jgi:hypothetical protein
MIIPGCTEKAETPRFRMRLSKSSAKSPLAVFALRVGDPWIVFPALEHQIVEVHIAHTVRTRREFDQARRRVTPKQRCEQDRQEKMPQVIGAELTLESVRGLRIGTAHDARVVEQHGDVVVRCEDALRAGANAGE